VLLQRRARGLQQSSFRFVLSRHARIMQTKPSGTSRSRRVMRSRWPASNAKDQPIEHYSVLQRPVA
jgi:hypothetical protein